MRIDVVSIFPEYLEPLGLSLAGKAQDAGLLDLHVHDLRGWTHDRHRTVDGSPYGGGAGMVMRPEPWGDALDAIVPGSGDGTVLVVPTPTGEPFTQRIAAELATAQHLVFACGRYEGIDQRVLDDAATRMPVRELSIGDYVLNGGEVAALVVTEAVARLLPGFMGNPESLAEESHGEAGLLEYPVYTKPASWRGHDVPSVLLSGDHGRIAAWRHEQAVRRTAARRPDLLHPSRALDAPGTTRGAPLPDLDGAAVRAATPADAAEILTLQLASAVSETRGGDTLDVAQMREELGDVTAWLGEWTTVVVHAGGRLVAAVRARLDGDVWQVARLLVAPDLRGRGLGRWLLAYVEAAAPPDARRVSLWTLAGGEDGLRRARKAGYRADRSPSGEPGLVHLSKPLRRS